MNTNVRELLNSELYTIKEIERVSYPEFEQINYFGDTFNLFDELIVQLGRPATQHEYIQEYIYRAKAFFTAERYLENNGSRKVKVKGITYSFIWNEQLVKAVIQRANRTYQSLMVEYTTALQIKELFPESKILMSPLIDSCFGSDIVLMMDGKVSYIHVFSDTYWGHEGFKRKEKRHGIAKNTTGHTSFYKRNWSTAHVPLAFGREENEMTEIVNGNPLLKEDKLKECIEDLFNTPGKHESVMTGHSQIEKFIKWCADNSIDYNKGVVEL